MTSLFRTLRRALLTLLTLLALTVTLMPGSAQAAPVRQDAPVAPEVGVVPAAPPAAAPVVAAPAVKAPAAKAPAAKAAPARPARTAAQVIAARGIRAVKMASTRKGSSYRYGAVGPRSFDCSGLTQWTFRHVGKKIARTAAAQSRQAKRISKGSRQPGDLVFFSRGSGVYHVAIYAGKNQIWHAARPGTKVRKERLWTKSVRYGRIV